jgi:DNA-binding transcriptional regulator YdaS (Cro superfamily)
MSTSAITRAVAKAGSQQRLAELIGVTQGLVSQWVNGARVATRHFEAIERETGITAQELLTDEMAKAQKRAA